MTNDWMGLDIGGANIKYSQPNGQQGNLPFELWKQPEKLAEKLSTEIPDWHAADKIAVTMTGELADCFETKAIGVRHICESVVQAADSRCVVFYQTTGIFVSAVQAIPNWKKTAASNWHALAKFIGRSVPNCIVIDIGSTTTDVIPVRDGEVAALGDTDFSRLINRELIYTGIVRSPVCAILNEVVLDDFRLTVAQEHFATMLDVYLVLGVIPEGEPCRPTADGRPATREAACSRLARMLCCDRTELSQYQIMTMARQAAARQFLVIAGAIETVCCRYTAEPVFVCVGEGSWLAREVLAGRSARVYEHLDSFNTANAGAQLAKILVNTQ